MASTATDPLPVPRQAANLPPSILLSPTNLPFAADWSDRQLPPPPPPPPPKQQHHHHLQQQQQQQQDSYYSVRTTKPEKGSIAGRFMKVFRKKQRTSRSSERLPAPADHHKGHRNSETYAIADAAGGHRTAKDHFVASLLEQNRQENEAGNTDVAASLQVRSIQGQEGEKSTRRNEEKEQVSVIAAAAAAAGGGDVRFLPECEIESEFGIHHLSLESAKPEKKSYGLLSASKNKFKSSLQLVVAKTFNRKSKGHRDRYLSESPSDNAPDGAAMQAAAGGKSFFHYNTVNADDYKEIFRRKTSRDSFPHPGTPPGTAATASNIKVKVTPPHPPQQPPPPPAAAAAVSKKNRFVVSSAARCDEAQVRKPTVMAQLLVGRREGSNKNNKNKNSGNSSNNDGSSGGNSYNTVGPLDNRDRRPSVTLNDFLAMYKEKNFADGSKKLKSERKRSISQSESETCPHATKATHPRHPLPPLKPPTITITPDDDEGENPIGGGGGGEAACTCARLESASRANESISEKKVVTEPFQQNSIPEHQEVHHETPPGDFLPPSKAGRKNRFLNRCSVSECKGNATTAAATATPLDLCPLPEGYDHSLTVSGYPRRTPKLGARNCKSRRMSEPHQYFQKWPELKKIGNEVATKYKKFPANSLGIDIPTDEFHNKLLVWIDKRGTKILPLPHEGQDVWSENRDENSSICFLAKRYKCYNVMPTSGKLVLFDSELPVTAAFEAFTFNRVRSAPIWDSKKKQLTGMLTVSDFIEVLLICADHPELFEKITTQKISEWKALINKAKAEANGETESTDGSHVAHVSDDVGQSALESPSEEEAPKDTDGNTPPELRGTETEDTTTTTAIAPPTAGSSETPGPPPADLDASSVSFEAGLISVESDDTLYDAIAVLRTFGFHRVLVMDYKDNDPLYILTYKRILYFIYVMMDTVNIPPYMAIPIRDLKIGSFSNLVTIKYGTSLREALTLLQWRSVSAIPVLDDDGKVIDLYTKEDVMNLVYNNNFTQLDSSIEEVIKDKRRVFEGLFKCKRSDSLMAVVQYFIISKAHRLVVATEDNVLEGIVSLSDVVNFMVLGSQPDARDIMDPCDLIE